MRAVLLALCLVLAGCGLEGEIFGPLGDQGAEVLPEARDTLLRGWATDLAGGQLDLFGQGELLPEGGVGLDELGFFEARFPGSASYRGLVLWASAGDRVAAGMMAELPRQPTVFHEERVIELGTYHPEMADLNGATTFVTLVVAEAVAQRGLALDAVDPSVYTGAIEAVAATLAGPSAALGTLAAMIGAIDAASAETQTGVAALTTGGFIAGHSFLSSEWLLAAGNVDYDGDGVADLTAAAFDAALTAAAETLDLPICYVPDRIPVVFHLDLRQGIKNRNCATVDPFKWTSWSPQKTVFFTGGVHEDCPVCGAERADHCLTLDEVDVVNQQLGGWVPNQVAMRDDGDGGDAVANDGVWTLVMELPYIPTATAPDGAGVRIGYKYTFGLPGQGWTDSEEWPGNRRLLELEDLSGDRIVTRHDIFGDEAANKDKVNAYKLSLGGCGTIAWEAERDPTCAGDSRENRVGDDGECTVDRWDSPAPAVPLTEPCGDPP